jgi:hypothetical protein
VVPVEDLMGKGHGADLMVEALLGAQTTLLIVWLYWQEPWPWLVAHPLLLFRLHNKMEIWIFWIKIKIHFFE